MRITDEGNLISYPHEKSTQISDLFTTKTHWNSVISDKKARYMCTDIKNMYLATPMDLFEYMRIPVELMPDEFMERYNLYAKIKDGYAYMQIDPLVLPGTCF